MTADTASVLLAEAAELEAAAAMEEAAALDAEAREVLGLPPLRYPTPSDLALAMDEGYNVPPHIALIHEKFTATLRKRDGRLIVLMPPQEGKSEAIAHYGCLWALLDDPNRRIGIASYEQDIAARWGRTIRNDLARNLGDEGTLDLGLRIADDEGSAARWSLNGWRGGVVCTGLPLGALTGRALDALVIDDPVKGRANADSQAHRDAAWDWWTSVGRTRLSPGAPVIVVQTAWHEDDLGGRLIAQDDEREKRGEAREWEVLRIPAQADHRPEDGGVDPIGREPGEYLPSARGRSDEDWHKIRTEVGARDWASLYQGTPAPDSGDLFDRSDWRWYDAPRWSVAADGSRRVLATVPGEVVQVITSWDMAFKGHDTADYVVGQVWERRGAHAYLLDQIRGRLTFTATLEAVRTLHKRWPQAVPILVEAKANGDAVLDTLGATVPGLVAINPKESKYARAAAISPLIEAHNIHLPTRSLAGWVDEYVEEFALFPNSTHDDQVDATSQALQRLFLQASAPAQTRKPVGRIERSAPGMGRPGQVAYGR